MKKLTALLLALMMIASAAVLSVSAEIIYEDDFESDEINFYDWDTGEGFWFKNPINGGSGLGRFEQENGSLNGYDDAPNGFSMYWGDETNNQSFVDHYPMFKEMTGWIDVKVDESGDSEMFCSGLVFEDVYDKDRGYQDAVDHYYIAYCAVDYGTTVIKSEDQGDGTFADVERPRTSFVRLTMATPRKDKSLTANYKDLSEDPKDHNYILGEYDVPGDPGCNVGGDPVKIGIRFGHGNITAYANGKIVASYDRETIGMAPTPAVWIQNMGCYVEFDNYGLGTYDHNVKAMTRLDSYELYEGKVTVMDGENVAGEIAAAEDDALKIEAPKVSGRKFVKWDAVSIDGVEITDANREKIELLYGIKIGSLEDEKFEITMPDVDVVLKAVYEDGEDDPGSGDVKLGDANGDGKINSKDVVALMKAIVGVEVKGYTKEAADMNNDGKVNSKDVVALMKYIVTH